MTGHDPPDLGTDPIKARGRDGLEEAFEDPDRFDEILHRRGVDL